LMTSTRSSWCHSAATLARAGGARLDAIAGMLGHTGITLTGVCVKAADKNVDNPARCREELMGSSGESAARRPPRA